MHPLNATAALQILQAPCLPFPRAFPQAEKSGRVSFSRPRDNAGLHRLSDNRFFFFWARKPVRGQKISDQTVVVVVVVHNPTSLPWRTPPCCLPGPASPLNQARLSLWPASRRTTPKCRAFPVCPVDAQWMRHDVSVNICNNAIRRWCMYVNRRRTTK